MNRLFLSTCMLISQFLIGQITSQPRWDDQLDLEAIEKRLSNENIIQSIPMGTYLEQQQLTTDFSSDVQLITLESGLKAVFKSGQTRYAERAAYKASTFLDLRLVPPTVLRTINETEGSLQFFVEPSIDACSYTSKQLLQEIDPKMVHDMALFYFIFGQWDISTANQIVQINNHKNYIALIDNACIADYQQVRYGDFPFVRIGKKAPSNNVNNKEPFPFDHPQQLKNASLEQMEEAFGPYLPAQRIKTMWKRSNNRTYAIWDNSLWIQYYKQDKTVTPNHIKQYYQSTIDAFARLNQEHLEKIFEAGLKDDSEYYRGIIMLILERRNQVIADCLSLNLKPTAPHSLTFCA